MQGLLASGHEMGMVGSCPSLDATTIYSARYMKRRGMGPMVIVQAVGHNKVHADVGGAGLDVQGGINTCDFTQDVGSMGPWICKMFLCKGCLSDVGVDSGCAGDVNKRTKRSCDPISGQKFMSTDTRTCQICLQLPRCQVTSRIPYGGPGYQHWPSKIPCLETSLGCYGCHDWYSGCAQMCADVHGPSTCSGRYHAGLDVRCVGYWADTVWINCLFSECTLLLYCTAI